jgi:8-oxo-dGTP diphosphatase
MEAKRPEHRDVALIALFDRDGRVLLQHRTEDAPYLPGCWGFFGGGMEEGETPEVAVRREAKEEIRYKLKQPRPVLTMPYADDKRKGLQYIFIEPYDPAQKIDLREGQGWGWFRLEEMIFLKIASFDREALRQLQGKF